MKMLTGSLVLAVLLQLGAAQADLPGAKYIGCYKDAGSRALVGQWTNGPTITNELCVDRCAAQGFKYAATQYSSHCFCGQSYDKYGPATNCDMKCAGDATQTCGGGWANQVYEISASKAKLDRVGCFRDNADRAVVGLWFDTQTLTNERCVAICRDQGFTYASTQYSSHCFCGNEYDRYGVYDKCNMACSGDANQICGGPWANSVFRTGSNGKVSAPNAKEIGCFRDAGSRVLTGLWSHSAAMTNAVCQKICATEGTKYAATQYSTHCFCGAVHNSLGAADNCNMKCGGQAAETCGGGWANQVYEINTVVTDPPTEPPTEKPTVPPTEPPKTCPKQREQFKETDIPVEPTFSADCKFELKQCNDEKCFCVKAGSGEKSFGGVVVPLGDSYDCSKKPKKCLKKRFSLLLKNPNSWVPECSKAGKYEAKQCRNGECWCVKTKSGKERKNTRTSGALKC